MQKFYFLMVMAFSLTSLQLNAQIEITRAEFNLPASRVDSLYIDENVQMSIPARGPNQSWDFSMINPSKILVQNNKPASSPDFLQAYRYSTSELSIQQFDARTDFYWALDASGYYPYGREVYDTAYSLQSLTGNPADTFFIPADIEIYDGFTRLIEFPANYGDSNVSRSVETTNFMLSIQNFGLNKTPGQVRRILEEQRKVAGWGTLVIPDENGNPSGPIPVLMIKAYFKSVDSIYVGGAPAPPALLSAFGTSQGVTVYDTAYVFYTENFASWVASAFGDPGQINTVRYRPAAARTISLEEQNIAALDLYPNPIRRGSHLMINTEETISNVQLVNTTGALVWEQQLSDTGKPGLTLPSQVEPGMYILQAFGASGKRLGHARLIIE